MHIEVIEGFEAFARLENNWDAVFAADPDAHFFLSSTWLSNWIRKIDCQTFVLGAKSAANAADYVAFFPLQLRTEMDENGHFFNEVWMGGAKFADYTGFISRPEFENEAAVAFADHLKSMRWTTLRLENIFAADNRNRVFLKAFSRTKFVTERINRIEGDGIDHDICPYVKLPSDWETYLNTKMSSNTRQKARRFLKRLDESGEFRITHADASTIDRDVNLLLRFWELKWASRKGDRMGGILGNNRNMLTSCFHAGSLFMPILWKGETPLAVLGTFMDTVKRSLHFFITGRDETFNSPPPGFILHAYSIRWAIQNGFTTYDFMRGNESYKYMFGTEERRIDCVDLTRKDSRNRADALDAMGLNAVLERAKELHNEGKAAQAERGYRQILDIDPEYQTALNLLGQLVAWKGDHVEAEKLFRRFLAIKPDADKVWFRLGKSLHAQGDREGAVQSYRKVLQLNPANREVPPLIAELSPLKDILRTAVGTAPSWLNDRIA
jgi:CelD/BcsL family acetyltransferase involved in cellulose biosynthesis